MKKDEYITITKESYQQMNHLLIERAKYIENLQEQLHEANEVIKKYATGTTRIKAKKYEGSCYITDPFTGEKERIEDWGEEYDADVPMSNDDKPAKEYLEKWGVE
jgi:hypothetical protein